MDLASQRRRSLIPTRSVRINQGSISPTSQRHESNINGNLTSTKSNESLGAEPARPGIQKMKSKNVRRSSMMHVNDSSKKSNGASFLDDLDSVSVSGDKPRGKYNPSNSGSGKYSIQSTSTWKSSVRLTAGALDENGRSMSPKSDHVLSPTVATEHGRWDRFKEHSSSYDELNGRSIKPVAADTHFLTPTAASRYASVRFDRNSEVMPWDLEEHNNNSSLSRSNFLKFREPSSRLLAPTKATENHKIGWMNRNMEGDIQESTSSKLSRIKPLNPNSHLLAGTGRGTVNDGSSSKSHSPRDPNESEFYSESSSGKYSSSKLISARSENDNSEADTSLDDPETFSSSSSMLGGIPKSAVQSETSTLATESTTENKDEASHSNCVQEDFGSEKVSESAKLRGFKSRAGGVDSAVGADGIPWESVPLHHVDESEIVVFVAPAPDAEVEEYIATIKHHVDESEKVHNAPEPEHNPYLSLLGNLKHVDRPDLPINKIAGEDDPSTMEEPVAFEKSFLKKSGKIEASVGSVKDLVKKFTNKD